VIVLGDTREGTVAEFDEGRGWGRVTTPDGEEYFFHCTAVADGTRTIAGGSAVIFEVVAGHRGRPEASSLRPA
jgi:CspA family cold shock protein